MMRGDDLTISACGGRQRGGQPAILGRCPVLRTPRDIFNAKTGKNSRA
jgi:hypothetical protein